MRFLHLNTVEKYTAGRRNWLPVQRCYRWHVCFEVKSFSAKGMRREKDQRQNTLHSSPNVHYFPFLSFLFLFPQIPLAVVMCRRRADPSIHTSELNDLHYNEVITEKQWCGKRLVTAERE